MYPDTNSGMNAKAAAKEGSKMEEVVQEVVQVDTEVVNEGAVSEGVELPAEGEVSEEAGSEAQVESDVVVDTPPVDEKIEVPKSDFEKLQAQVAQQEEFIQRRNNEVGDLRQQLSGLAQRRQELSKTDEELNDLYYENPAKAMQEQQELSRIEDQERYVQELETKASILQGDPQFEEKVGEIAELMIADGYSADSVQKFKSNPYWVDSATTKSYSKQVGQERRIKALEANNESLKQKPGEVASKIEAAANGGNTLTASTGGSVGGEVVVTSEMIEAMDSKTLRHYNRTGEVLTT